MNMNKNLKIALALAIAAIALSATLAYAAVTVWSNTLTFTPSALPTLTLSNNSTAAPYVGDTIHFTATLNTGQSGVTVGFYVNNAQIDSAITGVGGLATWDYVVPSTAQFKVNATCTA